MIKRVLGPALIWEPGQSKMYKNTRRSRTERVDDYVMKYVRLKLNFGPQLYLSSDPARPVVSAVNLKNKLIKAGYPVHGDLLIFPDQISFQVRTPITTTGESGMMEMDKTQDPPGRDGGYQFPPGPKVSKKDIKAVKKDPAKHLSDLFAKENAKKKMKEETSSGEYNDPISRMRKKDNEQKRNKIGRAHV